MASSRASVRDARAGSHRDEHPLARCGVVDKAAVARVAILAQDERLRAELDALRFPTRPRPVPAPCCASCQSGWPRPPCSSMRSIFAMSPKPGADISTARARRDEFRRFRVRLRRVLVPRRADAALRPVHAPVDISPVQRVRTLRPLALDPFQPAQPRTVREFVKHPRRDEFGEGGGGCRRQQGMPQIRRCVHAARSGMLTPADCSERVLFVFRWAFYASYWVVVSSATNRPKP